MNLRLLLRAARWARNPPRARRVVFGLLVIGLCLGLAGLEWAGLLPSWLGLEWAPRPPKAQPLG